MAADHLIVFTTPAFPSNLTAPVSIASQAAALFTGLNRYTIAAGVFIGSAIAGRLLAWQNRR